MKFKKINDQTYILRIELGEEIAEEITSFCKDLDIVSAEVYGIGAVRDSEIMHYSVDRKDYSSKAFPGEMEITSMFGFITSAGLHCHVTLANNKMQAFGGHLKSAIVSGTVELMLKIIPEKLDRIYEEETGLKVLDI
ncbi:MAG: PPC domain-containing DNA-binding protein [Candidatus Woesearchaeota archaeon]